MTKTQMRKPVPATVGGVYEQPPVAPLAAKGQPLERHGTTAGVAGRAVSYANRWRENYNPLRGLTMSEVVSRLEMAQRGDTALLQWTFRFIERRYPTLAALLSRCEAPLLNFDWEIKVKEELPPGATNDQAKAQQDTLKNAYDGVDNLKQAIQHLHLADFRGYAHIQKHRTNDGEVYHLETLDQWVICRDGLYGDWFWNPDSRFVSLPASFLGEANRIGGGQLPREDFIIRMADRPIDEIALINFVRANLCEKDWDGFIEIYGIPGGVVVMPPNVPQGKESDYETAAQKVAEGGSGAIPNGSEYKPNDGPRGVDPFTPRLKHLDEQLIMAGTGGKLTMMSESGSGTLAGGTHSDTFEEIADARADKISECFQKEFDAEVLGREHEGEPVLVYFKFGGVDKDSDESLGFKRDVIKSLAAHEILSRVLANQVDLKETSRDVGLAVNEEYVDPYVPVIEANGAAVTGELVKDADGDVIGGVAKGADTEPDEDDPAKAEIGKSGKRKLGQTDLKAQMADGKGMGKAESGKAGKRETDQIKNRGGAGELPGLEDSGVEHYAAALAEDLQVMREQVAALANISDDTILAQRALDLVDQVERIRTDIRQLPKSAQALAEVQIAALFTGLTGGAAAVKNRATRLGRILNGDSEGHPFHGNQWTDASGHSDPSLHLGEKLESPVAVSMRGRSMGSYLGKVVGPDSRYGTELQWVPKNKGGSAKLHKFEITEPGIYKHEPGDETTLNSWGHSTGYIYVNPKGGSREISREEVHRALGGDR